MTSMLINFILTVISSVCNYSRSPQAVINNEPACEGGNCYTGTCVIDVYGTVSCRIDNDLTASCYTSGIKNSFNRNCTSAIVPNRCTYVLL